jgi:hypothetical protein
MPDILQSFVKSRRFWLLIGGVAVAVFKDQLGLPLTDQQITEIVLLIGSWIVGESLRSSQAVPPPKA